MVLLLFPVTVAAVGAASASEPGVGAGVPTGAGSSTAPSSRMVCAISGHNTVEWAVTDFASMLAGALSVGLHMTSDTATVAYIVANAGVTVLVCEAEQVCCGEWVCGGVFTDPPPLPCSIGVFKRPCPSPIRLCQACVPACQHAWGRCSTTH